MDLMLFLGSGVSYPSGLPSVGKITNALLESPWRFHTSQKYCPGHEHSAAFRDRNWAIRLQPFLKCVKKHAEHCYRKIGTTQKANYEDIYYIVDQIADNESGEIINPAIESFIKEIKIEIKDLLEPYPGRDEPVTLNEICEQARNFIHWVVYHKLQLKSSPKSLDLLSEIVKNDRMNKVNIFTLNHDTLVERFLDEKAIEYSDGFSVKDGDVDYFEPSSFGTKKVNLFKLHGSLNWYYFRDQENTVSMDRYAKTHEDPEHCENAKGVSIYLLNRGKPLFLAGTYNKLMEYGNGIFRELDFQFHLKLRNHDVMIMSGYGWNDRGINGRLFDWVYSDMNKRLFLLHKNPDSIKNSKSGMWHRYDGLVKDGRLIPINKWLSDITWDELHKVINKHKP